MTCFFIEFEGDTLVAQAAVFFAAGYEASSGAMSFTLYEIALQPEIQHRLRAEILEKINEHGGITYEAIKEMKYLDMVLSGNISDKIFNMFFILCTLFMFIK